MQVEYESHHGKRLTQNVTRDMKSRQLGIQTSH